MNLNFQENVLSLNISSPSSLSSPSYSLATVGHNNISTVTVVNDNCTVQQQQQPTRGARVALAPLVPTNSYTPLQPPEEGTSLLKMLFYLMLLVNFNDLCEKNEPNGSPCNRYST